MNFTIRPLNQEAPVSPASIHLQDATAEQALDRADLEVLLWGQPYTITDPATGRLLAIIDH